MRATTIGFLLLNLAVSSLAAETNSAEAPPNIILILVDDMGWSSIGCYGGLVETPNIDALAEKGVRFNQFYNGARCCPTRATLMSGLHPHQVGVGHMTLPIKGVEHPKPGESDFDVKVKSWERRSYPREYQGWLDTEIPTVPEMLKTAGYGTYMSGKWHLNNENSETWPVQRGFDRFYGHFSGTSGYFQTYSLHRQNSPVKEEGNRFYLTDALGTEAIEYLSEHDEQKDNVPFFLYLAFNAPHFPLQSMPEDFQKYRGRFKAGWDILRKEKLERQKEMGIVPKNTRLSKRPDDIPAWDSLNSKQQNEMDAIMATYAAMVDRVDQNIGKLVDHLKATDEFQNTIIFFLSDNGAEAESRALGRFRMAELGRYGDGENRGRPWAKYGKAWANFSNTPCRYYKHYTHQGGVQTPLIAHWPKGIPARQNGRILSQNSYLPDLVETCIEMAGAVRPANWHGKPVPEAEGVSLMNTIRGEVSPVHTKPIMIEHEGNCMVRLGKWKLLRSYGQPWELYDIETDFSETQNLIAENQEVANHLKRAYAEWAERIGVKEWTIAKEWDVYNHRKK
jgi:arylsulfatase